VPELGPAEIHVWRVNLLRDEAEAARLANRLDAAERGRAARFYFARDRRRFVVRRAVLRDLLGRYLGCEADAVCLSHTAQGKPFVEPQEKPGGLRFSCSHSADSALIALARGREIGVDLEFHRPMPDADELAREHFSPMETAEFAKAPTALKEKVFFDCWTRKEAFVKAVGVGLAFPLNRFSVSLLPNQPAALLRVEDDPEAAERWSLRTLDVGPHCSAALAFEGKGAKKTLFEHGACLTR
jgi:4'-phosphopantetheinyl transferase